MLELPSQPLYVHINDIRKCVIVLVPDVLRDVAAAANITVATRKVFQQRILFGGQRHVAIVDGDTPAPRVEYDAPDFEALRQNWPASPPNHGSKTRKQLAKVEWLEQVVVRSRIQAFDTGFHGV